MTTTRMSSKSFERKRDTYRQTTRRAARRASKSLVAICSPQHGWLGLRPEPLGGTHRWITRRPPAAPLKKVTSERAASRTSPWPPTRGRASVSGGLAAARLGVRRYIGKPDHRENLARQTDSDNGVGVSLLYLSCHLSC